MQTYYDVLGVDRGADKAEIRAAYHSLAKAFHPDRHSELGETTRAHAEQVMARINEAYGVLSDPGRRTAYDDELTRWKAPPSGPSRTQPSQPNVRPPAEDECLLCGSHPAALVTIERRVGLLFARRVYSFDGRLCRYCGLHLLRSMTARTLVTGWWGVFSFLGNLYGLLVNFGSWLALRKLPRPERRTDAELLTPVATPLPPGSPLWQRPAFIGFAVALLILGSALSEEGSSSGVASSGTTTTSTTGSVTGGTTSSGSSGTRRPQSLYDLEGLCIQLDWNGYIEDVVPCYQSNDGEVIDVTTTPEACPYATDVYFESDGSEVLCIDE